ncbi:MAG TPA: iron ABC transporter permease [Candidatus Angelobacter sp.]|nr:iron ABC transporter permease [Candidatus Angelobacter sp.]
MTGTQTYRQASEGEVKQSSLVAAEWTEEAVLNRAVDTRRSAPTLPKTAQAKPRTKTSVPIPAINLILLAALLLTILLATGVGAVHLSLSQVLSAFLHPTRASEAGEIIFGLRLPRILAAALVGAALSATGVLFQGLFRNPLADPFVLGTSGGAALGGAIGIFLIPTLSFAGFGATAVLAFVGSVLTMVLVWYLARAGGRFAMETLLLAGFAIGTILNAATVLFELRQEASNSGLRVLAAWLHGQLGVPAWNQLALIAPLVAISIALSLTLAGRLNTLALGEEYAAQLGVSVNRVRMATVILGSLLTAAAVSLGGLIGFVGLLVPHFLRILIGPNHVRLLPAAALGGAVFLILADTFARTVFAPTEIPVGVFTALLGGPAFLYLLNHRSRESRQ